MGDTQNDRPCAGQALVRGIAQWPAGSHRMRTALLGICLLLSACSGGSDTDKPSPTSKKDRIFDTQREALDKAKGVNDTLLRTDQQRKQEEDQQGR
jgi:hypothetical protein